MGSLSVPRLAIALVVIIWSVGSMASRAAATSTATGSATVDADSTIAAGRDAATSIAAAACAKTKKASKAAITVTAGDVSVIYEFRCSDVATPAGETIFALRQTGTATTSSFKVPSNWDLAWSYDCSRFLDGRGNFFVLIYDDDGQQSRLDIDNQSVSQLGRAGRGVEHYHSGDTTKFLKIASPCAWKVTVTKA